MTSKDNRPGPGALSTDAAFRPHRPDELHTVRDPIGDTLRQRAEEITRQKSPNPAKKLETLSEEVIGQTIHELQVYQIELEMQNEELRRHQLELEAAHARYFDFYDQAPLGYCTLSEHGLILEANLTTASLLGIARGALLMQPISRFIHKESQDTYYLYCNKLFTSGEPQICQLRMVKTDGTPIWANLHAIATQNADNERICRLVITDITEHRLAEEEKARLEAMNRQLQKVESLGRMAGAVAHHFNNKLHVVMGYLELLKNNLTQGVDSRTTLTAAMRATDQAAEVSRMLLTYLGQVTSKQESLDLAEICIKGLTLIEATIPKGVVLETDLRTPGPPVKANANQIQQILTNLVTNAWESAGDGHSCVVRLSVHTVSTADIGTAHRYPINWQPCGSAYACLEVRDNGSGISKEDLEELFSPFFSTKFTGRGLGLPMVLGLVQAHGGGITVESSSGTGSLFRVFLPISDESVACQQDRNELSEDLKEIGTVLLIDDDNLVIDITSMMLAQLGFTVLSAGNGFDAVEIFRRHRHEIRLVLSDVSMPRMDGWETLTALRRIDPSIPVILASGYSEEQVMIGDHCERPQVFLEKPYRFEALKDAIRRSLLDAK